MALSAKLASILRAQHGLKAADLALMTEPEGWAVVYSQRQMRDPQTFTICFTGFDPAQKDLLTEVAEAVGMQVVTKVNKCLSALCAGADAGPVKLKRASEFQIPVISKDQFDMLIRDGELTSPGSELV